MKRNLFICFMALGGLIAVHQSARAQDTNSDSGQDYKSFQIISRRNMFDPSRRPNRAPSVYVPPRTARVDSFTLVGTMSYEQGQYAFFDSSNYQYRKTLKPADTIAGYKIVQIATDYVKLAAASNQTINLPVGTKMKRQEGGPWTVAGVAEPDADSPSSAAVSSPMPGTPSKPGAPAPSPAAESDALKRLMLKRLQEK